MRENRWPIAKFTFVALLCLQMVTLSLMLLISYLGDEEAYPTHVKRLMKAVAAETVQNVESLLYPAENLAVTAASLMESNVLTASPDEKLERYFFENLRTHSNFSGMYFGWTNGDFLYVTRSSADDTGSPYLTKTIIRNTKGVREIQLVNRDDSFIEANRRSITDNYDPRKRPWFDAIIKGSIQWTQPYIYHTSQLPGVTVSIPVVNAEGESLGVFGVDIEVDNLSNFLSKNELSANSIALITTDDNRLVAHTDLDLILKPSNDPDAKKQLAKLDEVDDECVNAAIQALARERRPFASNESRSVEFEHDGQRHYSVFHSYSKSGVDWTVIVISPENDFLAAIRNNQFWQIIFAVVGSLLLTLIAFLVVLRFLKPVKELQETVLRNPLTGLYNRRALDELGTQLLAKSRSRGQIVSVAIIDIDRFKAINDTFGHGVGDEVLVAVSQRMQNVLKKTDMLVRYGGEEFVLLLFGADLNAAKVICDRLRVAVNGVNIQTDSGGIPVAISVGVCEIASEDETYRPALNLADQALFVAKRSGRDRVCTPSDLDFSDQVVTP